MKLNEKQIGKRIEDMRKMKPAYYLKQRKYLTKGKLAKLLYMNVDQYNERIKGKTPFSIKSIQKICELYKVDPNYILFGGIE